MTIEQADKLRALVAALDAYRVIEAEHKALGIRLNQASKAYQDIWKECCAFHTAGVVVIGEQAVVSGVGTTACQIVALVDLPSSVQVAEIDEEEKEATAK